MMERSSPRESRRVFSVLHSPTGSGTNMSVDSSPILAPAFTLTGVNPDKLSFTQMRINRAPRE